MRMIKDHGGTLQNLVGRSIDLLRQPAGMKYQSMEDIRGNRDQFLEDFYSGLFLEHVLTVDGILHAEDNARSIEGGNTRENRALRKGWIYVRQIFRCINDSIVWILLQPEPSLFIRRTCRNQPRGMLRDQNYKSILKVMDDLFAKGKTLPIWNDATRCIDIHDITLFGPEGISFIEVKEGKVNEKISKILEMKDRDDIQDELNEFGMQYGKKGLDQFERYIRQNERGANLVGLVQDDDVMDPFLNAKRVAITPEQPIRRYDDVLTPLLVDLRARDYVEHSIEGCLHILAINWDNGLSVSKGSELIKNNLQSKIRNLSASSVDCSDVILSLNSSFDYPTAMPIMLRPWESQDIAKIAVGHTNVYFLFDINEWARLLKTSRLSWSSLREGKAEMRKRKDQRLFIVQDKIPKIIGQNGGTIHLGTQFLQMMICEGIAPSSAAAYYDQISNMENREN